MKLMLRPEDRTDRELRLKALRGSIFASGGIRAAVEAMPKTAAPVPVAEPLAVVQMPATAWRVPGFTRPSRLSRPEWLLRGFELLARAGHHALALAVLCDCPGGSRAGFFGFFADVAAFRLEMIALWESAACDPAGLAAGPALARLLELADEAAEPFTPEGDPAAAEAGGAAIERAIRDWARLDGMVAAALTRVDAWRLAELQGLLVDAGLSHRRAAERAAVFYAARLGFDRLRESTDVMAVAPMRALALAILGGKTLPALPQVPERQSAVGLCLNAD